MNKQTKPKEDIQNGMTAKQRSSHESSHEKQAIRPITKKNEEETDRRQNSLVTQTDRQIDRERHTDR